MAPSRLTPRIVRGLLLGTVLAVGISIAWTYRRPAPKAAPLLGETPRPAASGAPRTENLVFRSFKGDRESFVLSAREMVGSDQEQLRLKGVDLAFSFTAQGQPSTGGITADECLYTPKIGKAVFTGHVVVKTADGFQLRTDSLVYRSDRNLARTDAPVEFQRKDMSGRSLGATYEAEEGRIELPADVEVRIQDEDNPATEIKAAKAVLVRDERTLRFGGGVEVKQADDLLTARIFEVDFGEDNVIYRARAIDDVDLRSAGGELPGAAAPPPGGRGPRRLRGRKLDIWLRADRTLKEATAGPDAELILLPAPGQPRERRTIQARFLTFGFDEQGRLIEVRGQKDATFAGEPVAPEKGAPRTLRCQSFLATLDPATGEPKAMELTRDVEFVQGSQRGTSQKAYYDGAQGWLYLKEDPRLVDTQEGSQLEAAAIDVSARTGDLAAREGVRHLLEPRAGSQGMLFGSGQPVLVTAGVFDYVAEGRRARYRDGALLRSGRDEIRAPEIRVREEKGKRVLDAEGGVTCLLHPKREGEAEAPPSVDARGQTMSYDEGRARMVFKGEVAIRQGQIATKSPEATLHLTADGRDLEKLVAGDPVAVEQGHRRATGSHATYTPRTQTMVLTGDKVVLKDPGQEVQGRSVTFQVGDDRILVDGSEEVRTQTIFRKEPPQP